MVIDRTEYSLSRSCLFLLLSFILAFFHLFYLLYIYIFPLCMFSMFLIFCFISYFISLFKLLYIPLKKHYLVFKHMFKQSTIQSSKIILLHVLVRILSQIFLSHPWYYYSKVCYICYKYTMNCTALL